MNCNVIKDLLPLYVDGCCSKDSAKLIEAHLKECPACRCAFEDMKSASSAVTVSIAEPPARLRRVNDWKASVLQSVLLFLSFGIITLGVMLEASTSSGFTNGLWAFSLVIPATGFLLSLVNWYFVRVYKSVKLFSNCSCLMTVFITLCAYAWASAHYELGISDLMSLLLQTSVMDVFEMIPVFVFWYGGGIVLSAVFGVLSKLLSKRYANMLGKE